MEASCANSALQCLLEVKKGKKRGEPKGIRVSAVATTRKVIMATGAELRDCTMGWKGNGEWSEMKHELATLGSR